jgi:hypothetical protein
VNGQLHEFATLLSGINPRDILDRRLGGPQNRSSYYTDLPNPAPPYSEKVTNSMYLEESVYHPALK